MAAQDAASRAFSSGGYTELPHPGPGIRRAVSGSPTWAGLPAQAVLPVRAVGLRVRVGLPRSGPGFCGAGLPAQGPGFSCVRLGFACGVGLPRAGPGFCGGLASSGRPPWAGFPWAGLPGAGSRVAGLPDEVPKVGINPRSCSRGPRHSG
ncbi:hypothetical protein Vwe01_17980 [Micromonospora andamanensis]|nr:hypothetical protein Vwe01_17980 [Micromonospora andamanensis]